MKRPSLKAADMSMLSEERLDAELEKGYSDIKTGHTKPAKNVFADIRKEQ